MQYFPLQDDRFEHQFGISALPANESILEQTDHYQEEIQLRRELLRSDLANHFQALPQSEPAQREATETLAATAPELFKNRSAEDGPPLLDAAKYVQEDLVLLSGDAASGHGVIAGAVCFPSGWSIRDKIGKSIMEVHDPVPEYASVMATSTDRLLSKLKPKRPVWRMNWGVRPWERLDQSPKWATELESHAKAITTENAGRECFFRVERQTLSRLGHTNAILFTIHTHQTPLEELIPWQQHNLAGVLESCPEATLHYKGIAPIRDAVIAYLKKSRPKK